MKKYRSWGIPRQTGQDARLVRWRSEELPIKDSDASVLPYGLGRSYGDSCLNNGGVILDTAGLDRFMDFDPVAGSLRCEAGVPLGEILRLITPAGWFLPVTPGTRQVTIGGAIANDVHGKNHHRAGTFGHHVIELELIRSTGERIRCSGDNNRDWLEATIGGIGLTGLITWAEIRLNPIRTLLVDAEAIRFGNLRDFFSLSNESDRDYEHTVAWVDCLSAGRRLGRGIFLRGNHSGTPPMPQAGRTSRRQIPVPFDAPGFLLNRVTLQAFNAAYFHFHRRGISRRRVGYASFFYPLDVLADWNRLYGKRGLFQYQCVVPSGSAFEAVTAILQTVAGSRLGSFLSVLKVFGEKQPAGMMSFPRKGVTLAFDFPNTGQNVLRLMEQLDGIVMEAGGAVYIAKDARMSPESFRAYYPQWEEFARFIDPRFSSNFWRRVVEHGRREGLSDRS